MKHRLYLIYFISLIFLFGISYYALFCLQFNAPMHAEYWVYGETVLKRHIAETTPSPKILVIAGSNGLYGIDSKVLAKHFHRSVVNMAIYAGLPLEWILHEVSRYAKKNDIVILPLEWEYYIFPPAAHTRALILQIIAWNKDYFYSLNLKDRLNLLKSENYTMMVDALFRKIREKHILLKHPEKIVRTPAEVLKEYYAQNRPTKFSLTYENTDQNGDILNTCIDPPKNTLVDSQNYSLTQDIIYDNFLILKAGIDRLEKKGVKTFVTFPPMYKNNKTVLSSAAKEKILGIVNLLHQLHIKTLGDPFDYLFDREDFYDTHYHLRCTARSRRTELLSKQLQIALHEFSFRINSK